MPDVKRGESRDAFIGRCVPDVMGEGRTQKQALGKCFGMFRQATGQPSDAGNTKQKEKGD